MIGVALRSTMDIDASIKNESLTEEHLLDMISSICEINLDDDVSFRVKKTQQIMDEMEYPGIRVAMDATIGQMPIPMKLDISTGDIITPREIEYSYQLLIENRSISLKSYNKETVLAEKLQTILARGILNTRMRDFYDIHELTNLYSDTINTETLKAAFEATCSKRGTTNLSEHGADILLELSRNTELQKLWRTYQDKYTYATNISYSDIMASTSDLFNMVT